MRKLLVLGISILLSAQLFSQDIVINEINYKSSPDFAVGDWVELYNTLDIEINIGGWIFKDEMDDHIFEFASGTIIPEGGYLVICKNDSAFSAFFPEVSNYTGELGFSLSGGGELIRLFDNNGTLIDQVTYDDAPPWPTEPDGNGPTLELINPNLDNSLAVSWSASTENGTPGTQNSSFVGIQNISNTLKFTIFPNPALTNIQLEIPAGDNSIFVLDLNGKQILKETNTRNLSIAKLQAGTYLVKVYSKEKIFWGEFVKE